MDVTLAVGIILVLLVIVFVAYRYLMPQPNEFIFTERVPMSPPLMCPTTAPHIKINSAHFGVPGIQPNDKCKLLDVTSDMNKMVNGAASWSWPAGQGWNGQDNCPNYQKFLYGSYSCGK
jgi:hypothetical protein